MAQKQLEETSGSLDNLIKAYVVKNDKMVQSKVALLQSQAASLRNLEVQMKQLATNLKSSPHGALPSDTHQKGQ